MLIYTENGWKPFVFNPPDDELARQECTTLGRIWKHARESWIRDHNKVSESSRGSVPPSQLGAV